MATLNHTPLHEKPAYRPVEFMAAYSIGRSKLYEEIATGRLTAHKLGAATIILRSDAEKWASRLPKYRAGE